PSSRDLVMVASVPPANTTKASTSAATAPATTEATMARPAGRLLVACLAGSGAWCGRLVGWAWVLIVVSFSVCELLLLSVDANGGRSRRSDGRGRGRGAGRDVFGWLGAGRVGHRGE